MQTYSHAIFNAALGKQLERRGTRPMYWALVLGSLLPDLPLTILTINYIMNRGGFGTPEEMFGPAYDNMYFTDPVWISGHSLMHAPFLILIYLSLGYWFGIRKNRTWGKFLLWFAVGNGLHSFADILTHHNDGPLLLYPFHWQFRFSSPISYWDPHHYGNIFSPIEHLLDLVFIGTFVWGWWRNRTQQKAQTLAANPGD